MAHKSRLGAPVVDRETDNLDEGARFWSATLGYQAEADTKFPKYATLVTPEGEPSIVLKAVNHESRIPIGPETDDKEAEARRFVVPQRGLRRRREQPGRHAGTDRTPLLPGRPAKN